MNPAKVAGIFFILVFALCPATQTAEPLTIEQAKGIALSKTGNGGIVLDTDIDHKAGGGLTYEFEILADGVKFEIEIDGSTGGILEFSREDKTARAIIPASSTPLRTPQATSARMTAEAAQALALRTVGGGIISRYSLERDDGVYVHKITIIKDGKYCKLELDDSSASIDELPIRQQ